MKLGFDVKRVHWIMTCVKTVMYSVIVNGSVYGHIQTSRGIRQGDPLSPYLFLMCAEGHKELTGMKLASSVLW